MDVSERSVGPIDGDQRKGRRETEQKSRLALLSTQLAPTDGVSTLDTGLVFFAHL